MAWTYGIQNKTERTATTAAVPQMAAARLAESRDLRPKLGEPLKIMAMVRTAPTRKKMTGAVRRPHLVGFSRRRTAYLMKE